MKLELVVLKIGIIIPVINQFEKCVKALESVQTNALWTPYIMPQWEKRWPLSRAWNEGIKTAKDDGCTHILVINDDILFSPWTINGLIDIFNVDTNVVMTTGMNIRDELSSNPEAIKMYPQPKEISIADHPDFSCFMVTDEFFNLVGEFDENFSPAYYEDNDMHRRIKLLGYRAIATTAAPYFHYGSQSQNADPQNPLCPGDKFDRCRDYFVQKWGGYPDSESLYDRPYNNPDLTPKEWIRDLARSSNG